VRIPEPFLRALPPLYITENIIVSFRIPTNDRFCPLVVKLSSKDIRNRWIDGKRSTGALDGSAISTLLAGVRTEVNERLLASTQHTLSEARRAIREGCLPTLHGFAMKSSMLNSPLLPRQSGFDITHISLISSLESLCPSLCKLPMRYLLLTSILV